MLKENIGRLIKIIIIKKLYYPNNNFKTTTKLSDDISMDLKKRGMSFVGSITIYSYLQAIGIVDDHELECFCYKH